MNRQTAIGLVVGTIIALAIALITGENKYYRHYDRTSEVGKEYYDERSETDTHYFSDFQFNNTLILLALIGGTGLGYLFSEQIENKVVGIYRAKVKS